MIITTYQCDRCETASTTGAEFWTLTVQAKTTIWTSDVFNVPGMSMHVCQKCLAELGIRVRWQTTSEKALETLPSIEEVIADIVKRTVKNE